MAGRGGLTSRPRWPTNGGHVERIESMEAVRLGMEAGNSGVRPEKQEQCAEARGVNCPNTDNGDDGDEI